MQNDPRQRSDRPTRIGYVLKMFPRLSETFILNELLELERQGAEVSVFSLMYPHDGRFHGRLADLKLTAEYYPADKPDRYWGGAGAASANEFIPTAERWNEAADFVRRHSIPKGFGLLVRASHIAARVQQLGIDHLHAHFATVSTRVAALVGILTGVPFSFTAHAKDIFRRTVDRDLLAELIERSAFAITVSDFNREFILSGSPGLDPSKLHRIYNGLDLDFFTPNGRDPRPEVPHIVSVGRMVPKKGFDHLIRALALCRDRGMPFRATIVGDGEEMPRVTELSRSLKLDSRVTFTGALPIEKVRGICSDATFMALACVPDPDGNMDALPTVLLEALALDVPIVSTGLSGIPEIVGTEAGLLTPPGDEPAFASGIETIWKRIRAGELDDGQARRRAERLFDVRANVGTLHRMFSRSATVATA